MPASCCLLLPPAAPCLPPACNSCGPRLQAMGSAGHCLGCRLSRLLDNGAIRVGRVVGWWLVVGKPGVQEPPVLPAVLPPVLVAWWCSECGGGQLVVAVILRPGGCPGWTSGTCAAACWHLGKRVPCLPAAAPMLPGGLPLPARLPVALATGVAQEACWLASWWACGGGGGGGGGRCSAAALITPSGGQSSSFCC